MASPRIALCLAGCAAFINLYATQGLLNALAAAFHISARQASWSITVTTLAVAITAPFVGRLTGPVEQHRIIAGGAMLLVLPTLMLAWAGSFGELLLWRFAQGMLIPVVFATSVAYIGGRWSGSTVAEVTSIYIAGTVLGGFSGRVLTGWITELSGWRMALACLAGLNLLMSLAIFLLLPRNPRLSPQHRAGHEAGRSDLFSLPLLAAYGVGFCVLFAQVASFTYMGLYLSQPPFSLSTAALGSIYTVFLLALIVVPVAGRLSKARPRSELVVAAALLGTAGSLMTLSPALWLIILGLALSCTGVFLAQAATNAFITTHAKQNKASAVGVYLSCYYLGGSFGAAIPGALWEYGGWHGCIALIVVFQLLPLWIVRGGWKLRPLPLLATPVAANLIDSSSNKER